VAIGTGSGGGRLSVHLVVGGIGLTFFTHGVRSPLFNLCSCGAFLRAYAVEVEGAMEWNGAYLDEPAIWFPEPGSEGIAFELLSQAIRHAVMCPGPRHPQAVIVTRSGSRFGWNAINSWADDLLSFGRRHRG
jgi:hypothetical protein